MQALLCAFVHVYRLTRNLIRQEKTAAYANSGALPEYKRWIDPAITEKHFKEREAVSRHKCAVLACLDPAEADMHAHMLGIPS